MAESSFGAFLGEALELLHDEAPTHLLTLRSRIRSLSVSIAVEGSDRVRVQFVEVPWVMRCNTDCRVSSAITKQGLDALLDGSVTIEQSVHEGALKLQGRVDDVIDCIAALTDFVHGAIRCPSFPALYARYLRRSVA